MAEENFSLELKLKPEVIKQLRTLGFSDRQIRNLISAFSKLDSFSSKLEIKKCTFDDLKLTGVTFENDVSFSECKFNKVALANITSKSKFVVENCFFEQDAFIEGTFDHAKYIGCEFKGAVVFTGLYQLSVEFKKCKFYEKAKWEGQLKRVGKAGAIVRIEQMIGSAGMHQKPEKNFIYYWAWIKGFIRSNKEKFNVFFKKLRSKALNTVETKIHELKRQYFMSDTSEISRLFGKTAYFRDIDFSRPDQVYFSSVNLSETTFTGTNLRGVHLEGVDFYQPLLKRHGLIYEVALSKIKDKASDLYDLPLLESKYREMRVCLEESKDFGVATDMYVGEMEAKRKQLHFLRRNIFSTEALFRLVSNYGQSAIKAFLVLGALITIHFYISTNLLGHIGLSGFFDEDVKQTLRVVSFQNVDRDKSETYLGMIDTLFRILVPIQAGMFALALRIKIKRH